MICSEQHVHKHAPVISMQQSSKTSKGDAWCLGYKEGMNLDHTCFSDCSCDLGVCLGVIHIPQICVFGQMYRRCKLQKR